MFLATGQDPAHTVEGSNCITLMEEVRAGDQPACGGRPGDLRVSVTLPSLPVGTVGGGTSLPPQASCLQLMGCFPSAGGGLGPSVSGAQQEGSNASTSSPRNEANPNNNNNNNNNNNDHNNGNINNNNANIIIKNNNNNNNNNDRGASAQFGGGGGGGGGSCDGSGAAGGSSCQRTAINLVAEAAAAVAAAAEVEEAAAAISLLPGTGSATAAVSSPPSTTTLSAVSTAEGYSGAGTKTIPAKGKGRAPADCASSGGAGGPGAALGPSHGNASSLPGVITRAPETGARRLARVLGAAVMAGELSLLAALTSNDLVTAHMALNRKRTVGNGAPAPGGGARTEGAPVATVATSEAGSASAYLGGENSSWGAGGGAGGSAGESTIARVQEGADHESGRSRWNNGGADNLWKACARPSPAQPPVQHPPVQQQPMQQSVQPEAAQTSEAHTVPPVQQSNVVQLQSVTQPLDPAQLLASRVGQVAPGQVAAGGAGSQPMQRGLAAMHAAVQVSPRMDVVREQHEEVAERSSESSAQI